jgi:Carboxypeptidase regulatory-like domain
MKNSLRPIALLLGGLLLLSANLYASASATIEGYVMDEKGQLLPQAQIRVEGREGSGLNEVVRTDARGHYSVSGLSNGTFKITLIINGQIKACIANVRGEIGQVESLNFSLNKASAARPAATGKHYVWVPAPTGSQLAGSWVEVNDDPKKIPVGMKERLDWRANSVLRQIQANAGAARQM